MNKVILMGRLCKDSEVRYAQGQNPIAIARYTLAVDRVVKQGDEKKADFISCIAFGKNGEFAEKYLKKGTKMAVVGKGMKILIEGKIQTGSYEKDGRKVYTTDVVIERQEFAEGKKGEAEEDRAARDEAAINGFMNIPEGIEEELPFS